MSEFIAWIKKIDVQLFLFFNRKHNAFWDEVMYWITYKFFWIPFYILLVVWIIKLYRFNFWIVLLCIAALIFLSDQLSVHLFKNVFERYRPCHDINIKHLVHIVYGKCGGKYGFVSSHATNTFALATFLSIVFKGKINFFSFLIFFWATIVSYSRIYLGVHYPLDVLVGAMFGSVVGFSMAKLSLYINKRRDNKRISENSTT